MASLEAFIGNIIRLIINPLIAMLFALALMYLVFGIVTFIFKADDPKARESGKQHLIWGVVGMFIMVAVVSILGVLTNTFCPGHPFCRGY
jgi:hypothetical protein